jgi:hypothetical protein
VRGLFYIVSPQGLADAEENKHISFVDIEPTSGLIINAAERLQINFLLPSYDWKGISLNWNVLPG